MSKSAVVKYDSPPYFLVHKMDGRRAKWGDRVATECGYFHKEYVVAIVDRRTGTRVETQLESIRSNYRKRVAEAHRLMNIAVQVLFEQEGVK